MKRSRRAEFRLVLLQICTRTAGQTWLTQLVFVL